VSCDELTDVFFLCLPVTLFAVLYAEWAASPEGQAALAKLDKEREEVRDISRYLNSQALPALVR